MKYRREHDESYHLYFFDIEMPGMMGLELAQEIRKDDTKALFVFLTGYDQYVRESFIVVTFEYISKPVTYEKLDAVLVRAMQYLDMVKQDFVYQFRKNQFRVSCDDILYIEKKGRQAVIHTISGNSKTNMILSEIWKQLDERIFIHIHVSYIVNMDHLNAIEGDDAVLDNGERLLVSRIHEQALKEKHMELMRRKI